MVIKMINWWKDNFKRPSTWVGILLIIVAILLICDRIIIHTLLLNLVNSPQIIEIIGSGICLAIGNFLVGYKKKDNDNKDSGTDTKL